MKTDLNGIWKAGKLPEGPEFTGRVPGSVMNDMIEAGLAADPFYRDNEYDSYELFRYDFVYEREFELDGITVTSDILNLVCEGLDTLATIFINGTMLASTDNMHRTYRFDLRQVVRKGKNNIRVIFRSPVEFIERAWDEKGPVWGVCAKDGYQFIRKAHYMFGWDWGPSLPDCGIWRDIYIESYDGARIDDFHIRQRHEGKTVTLEFEASAEGAENAETDILVKIYSPAGNRVSSVSCEDGHASILIENPELWWPAGYGPQPLYRVRVELIIGGTPIDEKEYKVGLRTLGVRREDDTWGQSFAFNVNGIDIFAKGANYIPEDNILARCNENRSRKLLEQAAAANFNSIRVWGGGIYPDSYFYNICDELGLIVWQDFMFACAQYRIDDTAFVESVKHEMRDNIRRLRHHASLALWCGNNEMEWLWMDTQTEGRSKEQMDEYLKLFEGIMPPIAAEEDPDRLYWPASPSSGGGFDNPNDENRGDVHYWDVWHGLKPFTEYRKYHFRFCSEFGFQSFPCLRTVESFTLPEDRNIFSYVMESHQKNGGANGKILYYLSENFMNPKDFGSLLYVSQLLQAEAIRYGVEHWRRNRGRCMGSIYWQFNDCWPVASWSGIDSFHRWKALHYFAKRFYAPVMASAEESDTKVNLHVSNESLQDSSGVLVWKLMDKYGELLDDGRKDVTVGKLESKQFAALDYGKILDDFEVRRKALLWYEYKDTSGNESGSTLLFVPNKYFTYEEPEISFSCSTSDGFVDITIECAGYAGYVCIESSEYDCVFDDNFFGLVPGIPRTVRIDVEANGLSGKQEAFVESIRITSLRDSY